MEKFRALLARKIILFDGAMGTYLVDNGVRESDNKSIQSLKEPDLVKQIHTEYINSGADIITTNTFDANPFKLKDDKDQLENILKTALRLARDAITNSGKNVLLAGSIGPLGIMLKPYGIVSYQEMSDIYHNIASILLKEKPDLLVLETFSSVLEIKSAIMAIRKSSNIPIVASMTFNLDGISAIGDHLEKSLVEMHSNGADVVGINCFLGPKDSFDIISPVIKKYDFPFIIQPNAGVPTVVNKKTYYLSNPQYFKEYSKLFLEKGIRVIGSCCGTTPQHTSEMSEAIRTFVPKKNMSLPNRSEKTAPIGLKKKFSKRFIYTIEITPPRGFVYDKTIKKIKNIKKIGIDAVNVSENPLAKIRMSPSAFSKIILEKTGITPVLHFTLRDRNLLAIQSDLLGAHALGIRNIFAVKGDPSIMGDFPRATTVYDVDTVELIKIIKNLNSGVDIAGKRTKNRTEFTIGAAANPGSSDMVLEIKKVKEKIEAGADFIITQPVFSINTFISFKEALKDINIPIIAGLMEIKDQRYANFLKNEVPGFSVPDDIISKFKENECETTGENIAVDIGIKLKKYANGIYLVSSSGKTSKMVNILKRIKNDQN